MMKNERHSVQDAVRKRAGRSAWRKVAKWIGIAVCVLIGLPLLVFLLMPLWMTETRLTSLVNEEGSRYLNADIEAKDVNYSLWETFPRFKITTGEVRIISRSLDGVSPEVRRQLPDSAEFLGALKSFSGEINVVDLFMNRYVIHEVKVDSLRLNLVAYNDSINNYNIIPSTGKGFKKVPYISAEKIELKNPGTLRYTSVSTNTQAAVDLGALNLDHKHGRGVAKNTYNLSIDGTVTASSAGLKILRDFPFSLGGDLQLRFDPFGVELKDYSIDLGEMKSRLSMSLGVGDDPKLESFDYKISDFSLTGLLGYVPKEFVPSLQGLKADVQVSISAHLLSAWSFSSDAFPSVEVDFKIPAGNVAYTMAMNGSGGSRYATYTLRHSPIDASFVFDGEVPEDSYMKVNKFHISSDGVNIGLGAMVTRLTTHPLIATSLDVDADVGRSLKLLPSQVPVEAGGKLTLSSNISFSVASLSKDAFARGLENFVFTGDLRGKNLRVNAPGIGLQGSVANLNLKLNESADLFNSIGLKNPKANVEGDINSTTLTFGKGGKANIGKIRFTSGTGYAGMFTPQMLTSGGLPIDISGELRNVGYSDSVSKIRIYTPQLLLTDHLSKRTGDTALDLLSDGASVKTPSLDFASGKDSVRIHDLVITGRLSMRDTIAENQSLAALQTPSERAREAERGGKDGGTAAASGRSLPHTPEMLTLTAPAGLKAFMDKYSLHTQMTTGMVELLTPGLRHDNYVANIDLGMDEDDVRLSNVDVMIKRTRGNIKANLGNLRNFILGPASERNPLIADLTVAVDTVNINALARAYVESKGGMDKIPRHDKVTASDSVALMVPKNLRVRMDLTAEEVYYTNLDLSGLTAKINVHDGMADIPALGFMSTFGGADLRVLYDSRDINDMSLQLGLGLNSLNIIKMLKKFPSFTRMIPELKNVSGSISARVGFSTDIFPDMYINMPSVVANGEVEGVGLTVKQSPFIRKITKRMLIRTDAPIHIKDVAIHVGIHDNLLQFDPFNFEFDRYKLRMAGINNFNGDLYYHIGVEKSPVPFPFSVNVEGQFHHPKLRFGGGHYNTKKAEKITSQIQEENNMNMVLILRKLLRAFIGEAAEKEW